MLRASAAQCSGILLLHFLEFVFNFCVLLNHRIVSTYLVHHGYCATAEAFAKSTGQSFTEEMASIKNRQSKSIMYTTLMHCVNYGKAKVHG